jgi:Sec-independent protein secretion pathway component TatC
MDVSLFNSNLPISFSKSFVILSALFLKVVTSVFNFVDNPFNYTSTDSNIYATQPVQYIYTSKNHGFTLGAGAATPLTASETMQAVTMSTISRQKFIRG